MFCLSKGKPKTFNPIKVPCKNAGKLESYGSGRRSLLDAKQAMRAPEGITYMATKDTKYHPNIFTYSLGGQKTGHPAVFPDKLAEDQIISWSNEGDLVFDPFMGSGTVAMSAKKNGCDYIGFDLIQEYVDKANERIEKS
jgi:site-specific DNA-methyltransferase (adenine-specific)